MEFVLPRITKVVVTTTFFIILGSLHASEVEPLRIKGLWIVRESMVDQAEIDAALQFASESGFNHVFVQVRGRGSAYYNSLLVPKSSRVRDAKFDPLAYAVSRGHELGLNVHAWVTTYLLWSARQPPETGNHIYHMHPEWLEVDAVGNAHADFDLGAPRDGTFEGLFLASVHPEVNEYLQAVFTEILLHYNIDGLHLDYCRLPDFDYGYNEEGLKVFRYRHGFDPRDINSTDTQRTDAAASQEAGERLHIWNGYRRGQISDLVTALHAVITLSGKEILLTAAVKPNPNVAQHKYAQDWIQWLQDGILDYALPMNYTPEQEEYTENMSLIVNSLSERLRERVIMGVATYNQDATATAEKIRLARLYGFNAICVFSYDAHKTNLDHFKPILDMLDR
ncbi:MAG: family 10 glycosylhydrolase [Fidelibacterota bacterium]|nr:MAG: family 10 glycosylhydrolase [Candidatus Neomarinimicrobiota bacterium]